MFTDHTGSVLALLFIGLLILLVLSSGDRRQTHPPEYSRICPDCRAGHPHFASYCRKCGRRLTA
jgi:predicted amidophosphoribosyltransferase